MARVLAQKKEEKERSKMVVVVLLGDRRCGGGWPEQYTAARVSEVGKREFEREMKRVSVVLCVWLQTGPNAPLY